MGTSVALRTVALGVAPAEVARVVEPRGVEMDADQREEMEFKEDFRMLERIGFKYVNHIDPFDGGPHYEIAQI